ncbi:MAG: glycosyltransferase [Pseudoflavonifractor sp.]|nr:glycosyltransferase [Pseudoflavonifractor sp.]
MRLSIIIPVYNVEKWLERCVRSIVSQSLAPSDYEIILVDDGSPDKSGEIADRLAGEYANIRTFHQANQGQSVARNLGIEQAQGEYIWFVDSDDYLIDNTMAEFVDKVFNLDVDILCAQMEIGDREGNYLGRGSVQPFEFESVMTGAHALCHGMELSSVCNNLYRRKFLIDNNLRFYPGITQQDVEFNTRAFALAQKVAFFDKAVYYYFKTGASSTTGMTPAKRKRLLLDSAIVTRECKKTAGAVTDKQVRKQLNRRANSIIVGNMYSIMRNTAYDMETIEEFVNRAKEYGLYPIMGPGQSIKTTMLGYVFNLRPLYMLLCRMNRR